MQHLITKYVNGSGVSELSDEFGIHRSTVQRILKRAGVTLRKSTPRFKYDVGFFTTLSEDSCYWAGFIAADGCIRSDRDTLSIKLAHGDSDHLKKFKNAIKFEGGVHSTDSYAYIDISGTWVTKPLECNFKITRRKSETLEFPELSNEMLSHFLRGYYDGDGCITYCGVPVVNFTCASPYFMHGIQVTMRDIVGVRLKGKNDVPPVQKGMQISYSGKNAEKILSWLYRDSNQQNRLDRKYVKAYNHFPRL